MMKERSKYLARNSRRNKQPSLSAMRGGILNIALLPIFAAGASAACPTFHTFANGSVADASQVMDNFNYIRGCPTFTGDIGIGTAPGGIGHNHPSLALWDGTTKFTLEFGYGTVHQAAIRASDSIWISAYNGAGKYVSIGNDLGGFGVIYANQFLTASDARIKRDITDTTHGLADIVRIKVRDYTFIEDKSAKRHTGFVAQELKEVLPGSVNDTGDDGKKPLEKGMPVWGVDYGSLTPILVKAVQELKAENDALKARVAALEKK